MSGWNEEPLLFDCAGNRLIGILHRAVRPKTRLGVLVVVGGPQYRVGSHRQFVLMARTLASAGYPVLRFDYRGMGDVHGEPQSFEHIGADIRAALAAFRVALPELDRVVLWGLCDAASAILMLNPAPPEVAGRVVVNPWVRTEVGEARTYLRHYYRRRLLQRDFWRKLGSGTLDLPKALRQFFEALRRSKGSEMPATASYIDRMLEGALAFRGLTLLILSGRDLTAREFEALGEASAGWGQFLADPAIRCKRLGGTDHTFSDRQSHLAGTQATLDLVASIEGVLA